MSHDTLERFEAVEARLDALEALIPQNGGTKEADEEEEEEEVTDDELLEEEELT